MDPWGRTQLRMTAAAAAIIFVSVDHCPLAVQPTVSSRNVRVILGTWEPGPPPLGSSLARYYVLASYPPARARWRRRSHVCKVSCDPNFFRFFGLYLPLLVWRLDIFYVEANESSLSCERAAQMSEIRSILGVLCRACYNKSFRSVGNFFRQSRQPQATSSSSIPDRSTFLAPRRPSCTTLFRL